MPPKIDADALSATKLKKVETVVKQALPTKEDLEESAARHKK